MTHFPVISPVSSSINMHIALPLTRVRSVTVSLRYLASAFGTKCSCPRRAAIDAVIIWLWSLAPRGDVRSGCAKSTRCHASLGVARAAGQYLRQKFL
jgi:hypothetical protein